ncbi:hypothetical protein AtNW77_Chr3g0185391 [Arabidopsis thaliana]|uniref:Micronuclear linker histone polyprotein-like protein n=2 Tax=Arabidopsis TaxID=3701 RepID=A0A178VH39_ARATH|nr:hypothetical protein ISN45_At03g026990 [Arabidopsis thaliana x Arabidopsis arenosa]OAP05690.1 hypothetical protein AXX17_AT3G27570 [Arabidopsis thaliana]
MKERGKRTAMERRNDDVSLYYSTPSEFTCRKHPSVSSGVGICPYCLNDRLVNLVCSECGEQRLSSCSCSDISPTRTSNAAVDTAVGENVVRISSLIDEERAKQRKETKQRKTEEVVVFKRSSSSCVEINKRTKNHRFSRIGRFFRKINLKKERDLDKNDSWVLDYNNDVKKLGVSRSRSLCSFRGKDLYCIGSEEDGSSYSGAFSAARSSSVNGGLGLCETEYSRKSNFEGRKSNFSETTEHWKSNFEGGRKSNFSETTTENRKSNFSESEPPRRSGFEARKSNFSETEYPTRRSNFSETEYNTRRGNNPATAENHPRRSSNYEAARKSDSAAMNFTRRVMSMKESSYFTGGEEPGFIDLKFDSSGGGGGDVNDGVLEHGGGGSCRKDGGELRKSRKSFKGWKWIFGHHQHQLHHHNRDS